MKSVKSILLGAGFLTVLFASCSRQSTENLTVSGLNPKNFETEVDGKPIQLYTIKNANGMEVCVTNYGGRIVSIMVPDKNNEWRDVVLGFDSIADYLNIPTDFGAAIGRYANRINQGKIVIDGDTIQLPTNNYGHCLHGGPKGWQYQVYEGRQINDSTLTMTMYSPDGDQNYPGAVTAVVTYTVTGDNALDLSYKATTDRKTVINLTNHSYFNLSGNPSKDITDHLFYVNADYFTPVDSTFMTTGELLPVKDTPMDFTTSRLLGENITNFDFEQIKFGNGFDHNWCLNTQGDETQVVAKLKCPSTGICMEIYTNEPGLQVYSGNFLDGTVSGKRNVVYPQRAAICLETQKYPDTPNKPEWPSAYLEPGQEYYSHCIYKFSVEK